MNSWCQAGWPSIELRWDRTSLFWSPVKQSSSSLCDSRWNRGARAGCSTSSSMLPGATDFTVTWDQNLPLYRLIENGVFGSCKICGRRCTRPLGIEARHESPVWTDTYLEYTCSATTLADYTRFNTSPCRTRIRSIAICKSSYVHWSLTHTHSCICPYPLTLKNA